MGAAGAVARREHCGPVQLSVQGWVSRLKLANRSLRCRRQPHINGAGRVSPLKAAAPVRHHVVGTVSKVLCPRPLRASRFFFWCLRQWRRRATTRVCSCRGFLSMYGITQYHVIQDIDPCTVASGDQHPTSSQTLTHAQSRRYCARGCGSHDPGPEEMCVQSLSLS